MKFEGLESILLKLGKVLIIRSLASQPPSAKNSPH